MKLSEKLRFAMRDLFSPGASAYDERRPLRILILSVLGGIIIAAAFGFLLYRLNVAGRLGH